MQLFQIRIREIARYCEREVDCAGAPATTSKELRQAAGKIYVGRIKSSVFGTAVEIRAQYTPKL